jgi:hypothetical protein
MRNVLEILIGKRKRKRPLRRPRNRWEVQCKIKVNALLNIGLYYSALKMETERSSETFVPAQQTTSHVNVGRVVVLCYCIAKNEWTFGYKQSYISYMTALHVAGGPGSSVGIATGYGLDGQGIESQCGEIFRTCPDRPWDPPTLLYNGYRVFPGVKSSRGVTLTPHPLPVPWSRNGRAIPLLPLWAVRPVQSFSACTRVHFTFALLHVSTHNKPIFRRD